MNNVLDSNFNGPAYVIAIPCHDDLWLWVESNCPEDMSQAEFFQFLSAVGMQFMRESMSKLHTNAAGVLEFTGYYS